MFSYVLEMFNSKVCEGKGFKEKLRKSPVPFEGLIRLLVQCRETKLNEAKVSRYILALPDCPV